MTTTPPGDRDSRSVVQGALRRKRRLSVADLSRLSGLSETTLSEAEKGGKNAPSRSRLGSIASGMEYVPGLSEFLVDLLETAGAPPREPENPLQPSREEALRHQELAVAEGREGYGQICRRLSADWYERKIAEHRAEAQKAGEELLALPKAERWARLERAEAGSLWALVDWLCEASRSAASDDARRAVHLAELAVFSAQRLQCPPAWRDRLIGYALAFLANARRVAGDLPKADATFAQAWERWKRGAAGGLPLGEWRLFDLEASLRTAQQRWSEMEQLSRRALALAPRQARGQVLLQRSLAYSQMGDTQATLRALRQAKPLILGTGDARLECVLLFNLATTLEQLGGLDEAEGLLPEVRRRSAELGNELDLIRLQWLQARVDAARGRREKAAKALRVVAREFAVREIAFDCALAFLEEAVLRLEMGEANRAQELALDLHWIFRSQRVTPAMLSALRLYCQAAETGALNLEIARQALSALRRAKWTPEEPQASSC